MRIVTPPEPLVTVEEAKLALGFQGTSDRDNQIEGLILAAQAELDGPTGWVGISVAEQTVEVSADRLDSPFPLRYGPVTGVTSITYLDSAGETQTVAQDVYEVLSGSIVLARGQSWPTALERPESVRVTYGVGIDNLDDPRVALMKSAIVMHVKMTMDMEDVDNRRKVIRWLTAPLRVWG